MVEDRAAALAVFRARLGFSDLSVSDVCSGVIAWANSKQQCHMDRSRFRRCAGAGGNCRQRTLPAAEGNIRSDVFLDSVGARVYFRVAVDVAVSVSHYDNGYTYRTKRGLEKAVKAPFVVLVLLVASGAAHSGEWVMLRKPPETGESAPAGISVDSTSIEILQSGIRRAKVKVDFLSRRLGFEKFNPEVFSFTIWTNSYDCDKKMRREDSMETHWVDGSVHTLDLSNSRWYPKPQNPAVDPSFDFRVRMEA
jgi:hypothetical protein